MYGERRVTGAANQGNYSQMRRRADKTQKTTRTQIKENKSVQIKEKIHLGF